uniref:Monocarboxylate transporter 14 n=3 Tax=Schistosoma mansoni TaxID=6183 RepID=A0A3Q0KPF3_SCHMA
MSDFHLSSVEAAILPGMIFSMPQFFAPFLCPLLDTYGFSSGSAWGALLMWIGCFVSSFANSFHVLYLTLGILTSIGLQLTYLSALMSVTAQFENSSYFGLAIGLTMCGSGVGAFASNYLLAWLLSIWTWREVLLIESAILLNILVTASCSHHLDAELNAKTLVKHEIEDTNHQNKYPSEADLASDCSITKYFWNLIPLCLCIPSLFRFRKYPLLSSHSNIIKTNAENSDYDIVSKERINGMRFSNRSLSFGCPQFLQEFTSNFKRLFSPKLWKNPNFLFYVIANGIAGAGVVIPWTFVYDHVLTTLYYLNDQNSIGDINNQDISWLPSLIGFGLLFGQLFYGLITSQFGDIGTCFKNNNQDSKVENGSTCCQRNCFQSINKKCPSSKYQFHLAIFLITLLLNSACTLTLALVPLWSVQSESKHFELFSHQEGKLLALACFFVGISNGGLYVMFPQLIIDIVGTELWSSGLGLFLTFNGLMNLCGTNIGGKIYDTRGSYQMALLIAAFLSLFAFLLVVMKEIFTWLMKRSTLSANSD